MKIRIMLVDDEMDALKLLGMLLSDLEDIEIVGSYTNPHEALKDIDHLAVDAVFLHRADLARKLRVKHPKLQIVFITAYAEYAVEAFEIRSTDYLLKPVRKERLLEAISNIRQFFSIQNIENKRQNSEFWIQCLGNFQIYIPYHTGIRTLTWKTKKEKELCAYLIHSGSKGASTISIIEALWPEYDLDKAKSYLYTCLSYLRKNLANHKVPIRIEKKNASFVMKTDDIRIDVVELEQKLRAIQGAETVETTLLDQLAQYKDLSYMGDNVYGWANTKSHELAQLYISVLDKAYEYYRAKHDIEIAIVCLQRILEFAADSERYARELIHIHLMRNDRNEALSVYRQLYKVVHDQLGAELEIETLQLIRPILDPKDKKKRRA